MEILWYVLIFIAGVWVGFLLRAWLAHRQSYDGKIVVTHSRNKTLYSLELEDYPDKIEFKKEVHLKVDTSDENLNRD